jgi:hypothetical protein
MGTPVESRKVAFLAPFICLIRRFSLVAIIDLFETHRPGEPRAIRCVSRNLWFPNRDHKAPARVESGYNRVDDLGAGENGARTCQSSRLRRCRQRRRVSVIIRSPSPFRTSIPRSHVTRYRQFRQ